MISNTMDSRERAIPGQQPIPMLLFLLLPLLLTLLLYWPTLSQPYFWDDVPHFDFATTRTFWQIWTDVRGLSYYRPVTFTLYKIFFEVLPYSTKTFPHLFLLLTHTTNAWLVGILTRRLFYRSSAEASVGKGILGLTIADGAGLLGALLFVSYPFAALPVAHFAAMMHPLVTLFTLGATLSELAFATWPRRLWLVIALALALLAPFVHESGIMAGAVAATVLSLYDASLARRNWKLLLALPCSSALFLPVWLIVPKTPNTFEWIGWGGVLASTTFFAQGPTFPLQPLSRQLIERLVHSDMAIAPTVVGLPWWVLGVICGVATVALLIAGLALCRAGRLRILGISLAWAFLTALPSIVILPFPYVSVSQRLLYSGGPPAAILWATVCTSLAAHVRRPWARVAVALGLATLVAFVPVLYVQREMALHELALRPLEQLATIGHREPAYQHLVVNAVNWINYKRPWYALGQEGVSVSADYIDFEQLIQLNAGTKVEFATTSVPSIKTELTHHYYSTVDEQFPWDWATLAARVHRYDRVWLTAYHDESIDVQMIGSVRQGSDTAPLQYLATFDDKVFFLEATLDVQGSIATTTLSWRFLADLPDATIFSHVLNCDGRFLGQEDGFALGGMLPFGDLAPGTEVQDVRSIHLAAVSADGCYMLNIGLYLPDGRRVAAKDPNGRIFQDSAVPLVFPPDLSQKPGYP